MFRYILLFTLVFHGSLSQDLFPSDPSDITTKIPDPTTGSHTDLPSTTEVPNPTTTEVPETTTDAETTADVPNTTTDAPNTTTDAPTTTVAPETTTEPVPPTTPAPEWKPGNWTVGDGNVTCIIATMALEFKIPYRKIDGKNATGVVNVPPTAIAKGTCSDEDNQTMSLYFPVEGGTDMISFVFSNSGSASKNFIISSVELNLYLDGVNFPNASLNTKTFKDSKVDLFLTQVGKSYKCKSKVDVTLTEDEFHYNATMVMKEVQIEAFRSVNDTKFGVPMLCSADEFTSDIVPIAVGCALAALVVIVIIAYLVGRRRARAKGYQSM